MSPMERRLSSILNERYHEIWREEAAKKKNEAMRPGSYRSRHPTYSREIMLRARRRWHIMLRSLGAATAPEQWDPTPPEPHEVRVADPSGFELELPNGFVVMPLELAQKILVLGGLP